MTTQFSRMTVTLYDNAVWRVTLTYVTRKPSMTCTIKVRDRNLIDAVASAWARYLAIQDQASDEMMAQLGVSQEELPF